jgi:PH (Pleckstrin Homology) domain-containing protein/putative oligomerization/nucleic acid binding protein
MSYAKNLLSRGEEVVFESRQHWLAVLGQTWLFVMGAILVLAVLIWATSSDLGSIEGGVQVVSLVLLIISLAFLAIKIWAWRNQEYLITTRRVIKAEGIFNKQMGDSSLEKVNDARLTQSWVGRIFDYGNLDIMTASEMAEKGMVNDFPMLAEPVKFKVAMLNQKERLEFPDLAQPPAQRQPPPPEMQRAEPMAPRAGSSQVSEVRADGSTPPAPVPAAPAAPAVAPAAGGGSGDVAARLESLGGLRDKGLITPEEYEAKKRELLERL